ncbi:hypothetical protein [Gelidibacter salicanalis]|uniref:Uncharacterized protein n=1 Tax=Gelidibacter salicanalis TaxID=291193 RepID=A0A934NH47_9FLAO|nr:hypothetical protein [Gelidibacter salicanalis]MBJ7880396.1 hypothetical protein [Gelidibacter salicanalis]
MQRVSVKGLDKEGSTIFLEIKTPNIKENNLDSKYYKMPATGGAMVEIIKEDLAARDKNVSPDGLY